MLGFLYKNILKPVLFKHDPEKVHDTFTDIGEKLGESTFSKNIAKFLFDYKNPKLEQKIKGISFKNPVGLSAGFDKDGKLVGILPNIGFGFSQIGSVTHKPYEGNPKPRLYRLPKSKGLVVYYGLKNEGVEKISKRVKNVKREFPVSFSVAKTNCKETTEMEAGIEDYCNSLAYLKNTNVADFYTINISCPNTFGGEQFTTSKSLEKLLVEVDKLNLNKPVFVKMPINHDWKEFKELLKVVVEHKTDGVVIGNLNKDRNSAYIKDYIPKYVSGSVSGIPTRELSNNLIKHTYMEYGDRLIIIGVGGVFSAEDAYEKIKLGASLVQLITGMIYEGPQLIGDINRGLVNLLEKDGFKDISEAVGSGLNEK